VDLSEILLWLGGGAVTSGIVGAGVSNLVAKRIAHSWERKHQRDLEAFKAESERDRAVLSAVIQSHSAGQAATTERRLVAVESLWSIIRMWRDKSRVVIFFFSILHPSEYNDLNPTIKASLNSLGDDDLLSFIDKTHELELHRPFLGERLWLLFRTYSTFLGRLTYKLTEGYKLEHIRDWREDEHAIELLRSALSDDEMSTIMKFHIRAIELAIDHLDYKILTEIDRVVSG
jgi:hypothetical protein